MKVGVFGATGFVGSAILDALTNEGIEAHALKRPQISFQCGSDPTNDASTWIGDNAHMFGDICRAIDPLDAIVIACGMAAPNSSDTNALMLGNAVLPAIISRAAVGRRIVFVSSAAVQGETSILNEDPTTRPFSPYSYSKAAGERVLLAAPNQENIVVYRPTSVHGLGRPTTDKLVRLAGMRLLPLFGDGQQPLPLAHIDFVGAAAAHLVAKNRTTHGIVLHPWEGMTLRGMYEAFGGRAALWTLPNGPVGALGRIGDIASRRYPSIRPNWRRIELLLRGQKQESVKLANAGFHIQDSYQAYRDLGADVRSSRRSARS